MKSLSTIFFILFIGMMGYGQFHDNIWLTGYGSEAEELPYGGSIIDFNTFPRNIEYEYRDMEFSRTCISICDSLGELQFYSNGIYIANKLGEEMENGDSINAGPHTNQFDDFGFVVPQALISLPYPNSSNIYILFHQWQYLDTITFEKYPNKILYTIVDMNANNGLGQVLEKNIEVLNDTLDYGKITATKHANGQDWWILMGKENSNQFFRLLLTSDGIENLGLQEIGVPIISDFGGASFSPDGQKYAKMDIHHWEDGVSINLFDFDRCSGILSNQIQTMHVDSTSAGGVAFSPNSRFLYVSSTLYVYQYDLWEEDVIASEEIVAVYDGFWEVSENFRTYFFMPQLAPDGKIYITSVGAINYMHIIDQPNKKGVACNVLQHALELPTYNAWTIPNNPNYRLGPIDGSSCDTLGIDNHPLARFTYDIDGQSVTFTDNSFYEPADWFWDFDGIENSTKVNPIFTFPDTGYYEVCLTVSNINGADTYCLPIYIETPLSVVDLEGFASVSVYPNPVEEIAYLDFSRAVDLEHLNWHLYDELGRKVKSIPIEKGRKLVAIDMRALTTGLYFWELELDGRTVKNGKLVK